MGSLGFSYVGLCYLLMLVIPNLLWARDQSAVKPAQGENKILQFLERIGQAMVTMALLVFSNYNPDGWSGWTLWLAASLLIMLLYEGWWIRYFRSEKTLADFYRSFAGFPVAGATLPILAFVLLGIYGQVIWLLLGAVIMGVGHIGIHLQHRRKLQ